MKKIICLATATLTLLGCDQSTTSGNDNSQQKHKESKAEAVTDSKENQGNNSMHASNFFTLSDAEKILGEEAHLTDSSSKIKGDTSTYNSAYTANSKDEKTGKTGAIYFMFEEYAQAASAKQVYASIKKANENHGIKELHDLGDEAYFHSDGENFYFILVRKGGKMFRMKVNKITGTTSLDEFNLIARNITAAL